MIGDAHLVDGCLGVFEIGTSYGLDEDEPVRLELRILAPYPGFGNVARRPTSVIR